MTTISLSRVVDNSKQDPISTDRTYKSNLNECFQNETFPVELFYTSFFTKQLKQIKTNQKKNL